MKLKDLLAGAMAILLCSSCIKDEAPNAEADILTCTVPSEILLRQPVIQNNSITIMVKPGTNMKQAPSFTLTEGSTIDPASGEEIDFTVPQTYTVTSESKKWKKTYTISFTSVEIPTSFAFEDTIITAQSKGKYYILVDKDKDQNSNKEKYLEWASGNPGFSLTGVAKTANDYPTVQVNGGVNGGKCVMLTTRETGTFGSGVGMPIAAGNLFTGNFNLATALKDALKSTQFGVPFYHVPTKLTGYYKYKAGEVFMSKGNPVAGKKDTYNIYAVFYETDAKLHYLDGYFKAEGYSNPNLVAMAMAKSTQEVASWTRFEIPFEFIAGKEINKDKLANGDYNVAIIFSSSINGDVFEGAPGSTLWIDNVELEYKD